MGGRPRVRAQLSIRRVLPSRAATSIRAGVPAGRRDKARPQSRRALLGWGGVAVACLAAGALAVTVLSGGGDDPSAPAVPAHPGIVANGSPRAIDGSVEDSYTDTQGSYLRYLAAGLRG